MKMLSGILKGLTHSINDWSNAQENLFMQSSVQGSHHTYDLKISTKKTEIRPVSNEKTHLLGTKHSKKLELSFESPSLNLSNDHAMENWFIAWGKYKQPLTKKDAEEMNQFICAKKTKTIVSRDEQAEKDRTARKTPKESSGGAVAAETFKDVSFDKSSLKGFLRYKAACYLLKKEQVQHGVLQKPSPTAHLLSLQAYVLRHIVYGRIAHELNISDTEIDTLESWNLNYSKNGANSEIEQLVNWKKDTFGHQFYIKHKQAVEKIEELFEGSLLTTDNIENQIKQWDRYEIFKNEKERHSFRKGHTGVINAPKKLKPLGSPEQPLAGCRPL